MGVGFVFFPTHYLDHSFWIRPGPRLEFWVLTRLSELFFKKSKRRRFSKKKKSADCNRVFD